MDIGAIVLAAGKGKRMKSGTINKVAFHVGNKPMILHTMDLLKELEITAIVVVVGFAKKSVMDLLGNEVIFAEQKKRLGTAHAVFVGLKKIPQDLNHVLILQGDDSAFFTKDMIQKLIDMHAKSQAFLTLLTVELENPFGLGRVVRNAEGKIMKIVEEKDASKKEKRINEICTGCYVFNVEFLKKNLPRIKKSKATGEYYLTELVELASNDNIKMTSVLNKGLKWRGVNTLEELKQAEKLYAIIK